MKTLSLNDQDHRRGDSQAKITLVEFGDFQCPYCAIAFPIVEAALKDLGDKVQFVFRNFPLVHAHPFALVAALTAEAAGRQGRYWEMHRLLFEHQDVFRNSSPHVFAEQLGLDLDAFEIDLQSEAVKNKVELDYNSGVHAAVNGTPAFFINGEPFVGDWTSGGLLDVLRGR